MKRLRMVGLAAVFLAAALLVSAAFGGEGATTLKSAWPDVFVSANAPTAPAGPNEAYTGKLRIYIVEPFSRHRDATNHQYEFGFIDFGLVKDLNIADGEIFDTTIIWDGSGTAYSDISQYNIMAMAAVFDPDGVTKDAYPNHGNWFSAHFCEAAAQAKAGKRGRNYLGEDYTHTVFVEEGTATW